MGSRGVVVLVGALVVVACGCRSIRNVRVDPRQSQELTAEDAQKLRVEGMALYDQQPRTLEVVTDAAHRLEQAAHVLRDDYDAQWQAAEALAFLAENETRPESRRESARQGINFARHARELKPDGAGLTSFFARRRLACAIPSPVTRSSTR